MAERNLEIIATFRTERRRFENADGSNMAIISVQLNESSKADAADAGVEDVHGYLTAKGEIADELVRGMTYRFLGYWSNYKNYGMNERQFSFRTYVPHVAHDPESLASYIAAAGRGNGIGPSKAHRLVKEIGVDSILEVCRTQPDRVAEITKIAPDHAKQFSLVLIDQQKTENATLELDRLLSGRGFPRSLAKQLIRTYGNTAAQIVTDDPFVTMQYDGVGFKKADTLYMQLGKDPRSLDRLALCLWYGMNSANSGDSWFPAKLAVEKLNREAGGTNIDFRGAILRGKEFAALGNDHYGAIASIRTDSQGFPQEDGPQLWLAEAAQDVAERSIVDSLRAAREECETMFLSTWQHTEREVQEVATHARCVRCYRPLTAPMVHILAGKPYGPTCIEYMGHCDEVVSLSDWLDRNPIVRTVIEENQTGWFQSPSFCLWPEPETIGNISDHQSEQIGCSLLSRIGILTGAPGTGKTYCVAQLIKAITSQGICGLNDILIGAPTGKAAVRLTEMLSNAGINKRARTLHSLLWGVSEDGKLPCRILIVDETSMVDLGMMAAVLRARPPGGHVIFIGDPNQLPPVGNGAPFRDLIAAGITQGHLTEIRRNAGQIVEACARIRDNESWGDLCNQPGGNLFFHEERQPEAQLETLENKLAGLDKWESQVLVALNDKGPLARQTVNIRLQQLFNPDGQPIPGSQFRIGDKVVCLKNSDFEKYGFNEADEDDTARDGQVKVANGELGEITDTHSKGFIVRTDAPRRSIIVPLRKQKDEDEEDSKEKGTGSVFDLGYALSVHKSQGSEFLHTFVLIDDWPGARQVCDASWCLTGISRGRITSHCIGKYSTAERFCRVQRLDHRKTFLKERIIESMISMEMAGL